MSISEIIANESGDLSNRYQVSLTKYSGPMDLLLALIEQEALEITEIALAQVTDQYLAYIESLQQVSPDDLTEFLVVAARLLLLKSQILLPKPPPSIIEDEETSADDLIQQLKDYKRFKQLASELSDLQNRQKRSFIRLAPPPKIEPKLNLGDVDLNDLLLAVRHALAVKPEPPNVDTVVSREVVTIGAKINAIRQRLSQNDAFTFSELLSQTRTRVEVIVTLLAVLELIKRRAIDVEQPDAFGEIEIVRKPEADFDQLDWEQLEEMEDVS